MSLSGAFHHAPVTTTRTSKATDRLPWVERLRVLAMLDIVAYHVDPFGDAVTILGGGGLVAFLLLAHIFHVGLAERMPVGPFARLKVRRLMIPWLAWSLIYLVFEVAIAVRAGQTWHANLDPWMVTYGASLHLWFVPFACFTGILVVALHRTLPRSAAITVGALVLGVASLIILRPLADDRVLGVPAAQYVLATPAIFLGFGLGRFQLLVEGPTKQRARWAIVAGAAALAIATPLAGFSPGITRWCLVTVLVLAALRLPGKLDRATTWTTEPLFIAYLVHMLPVRLLYGVGSLSDSPPLHIVAAAAAALLLARLIYRSPFKAVLG